MIAVPFLYFMTLLLYIVKRRGSFDVVAYVVLLYAISGFFSILVDYNDLRSFDTRHYNIGFFPTVIYCGLLSLTILPFLKFDFKNIQPARFRGIRVFNCIVYFYFFCFVVVLITSYGSISEILTGDFGELRRLKARGEEIHDLPTGGGVFHPIILIANIFGGYSIIMLLFYFYSICFLNKPRFFNFVILLSSTTIILIGIMGVDRSKTVYWLITYGFMLVLFWYHMSPIQRHKTLRISVVLVTLFLSYFVAVTISRFEESQFGTEGGIISYAGQSFINFCFFYDEVDYRDLNLQRIFPLFYKLFVDTNIESSVALNAEISFKTGKAIGVFSTFIGDIMVASGEIVVILYCFAFNFIVRKILPLNKRGNVQLSNLIFLFYFISFPMLGVFVHFYAGFPNVIASLCFLVYGLYLKVVLKR